MDLVQQARDFIEKANVSPSTPATYILRLTSGAYYIGATTNLLRQMFDHLSGTGGRQRATRIQNPCSLLNFTPHLQAPESARPKSNAGLTPKRKPLHETTENHWSTFQNRATSCLRIGFPSTALKYVG
jgi:predicted GIY-YIG superfamily endonuclease